MYGISTAAERLRTRKETENEALMNTAWSHFRWFEAAHRNSIWQGDVQHTLYLPDPEKPARRRWPIWLFSLTMPYGKDLYKESSIKATRYTCFFIPFGPIGK